MIKNILVTGGKGRFANELRKTKNYYNFIFRDKKQLNILSINSIKKNIKKFKALNFLMFFFIEFIERIFNCFLSLKIKL